MYFVVKTCTIKKTEDGLNIMRNLDTVKRQIQEIKNAGTQAAKKRLGVKFGLDVQNLDTVIATLDQFDITQDLPADILHHFTLGWGKKSFIFFQE